MKKIRDLGQCEESLALKEVFFSTASRCAYLSVPQFPLQMGLMLLLSWHVVQGVNVVGLVWCSGDSLDCSETLKIIIISFVEYPGVPSFWLIEFTWLNPQGVL